MSELFEPVTSEWHVDLEQATAVHPSGLVVHFRSLGNGVGSYVGMPLNPEQVALRLIDEVEDEAEVHEIIVQMLSEACDAYRHQLARRH
jgi:hypothetical protein